MKKIRKALTYKEEEVREIFSSSKNITEVCERLSDKTGFKSINYRLFDELVKLYKLDPDVTRLRCKKKYTTIIKVCPQCKKEFSHYMSKNRDKITCSKSCANKQFRSGKNHPAYNRLNLKSNYVKICFRFHVKKCIICNEDKIVTVHHYNENHDDDRPQNLVPLCPTHHMYMHSKHANLIKEKVESYVLEFEKSFSLKEDDQLFLKSIYNDIKVLE